MAIPASAQSRPEAFAAIQRAAKNARSAALSALSTMQTQSVDTNFAFAMLDQSRTFIAQMNLWKDVPGLDAYFNANVPGYVGVITTDILASTTAAETMIGWLATNFPRDPTALWILGEQINPNGTRTQRQFTPVQTASLQTLVQNFINTIS